MSKIRVRGPTERNAYIVRDPNPISVGYSIGMPRIAFVAKTSTNVGFLYRSGTGERCRIGAGRRFVFIHQVAELFCMK